MPRKKNFVFDDTLRLPPRNDLINTLDNFKERAPTLTSNDTNSFWEYPPYGEIMGVWKSFLLEIPIFKKDRAGGIMLRDLRNADCELTACRGGNAALLLNGLSGELFNFYMRKYKDAEFFFEDLPSRIHHILDHLKNDGKELIRWRIVKKRRLYEIFLEIETWNKRAIEKYKKFLPAISRHAGELETSLYRYFKCIASLKDDVTYNCLAHIMKHLGIEKGAIKQISQRIRKRIERNPTKIEDLDIERLKATLSDLRQ